MNSFADFYPCMMHAVEKLNRFHFYARMFEGHLQTYSKEAIEIDTLSV